MKPIAYALPAVILALLSLTILFLPKRVSGGVLLATYAFLFQCPLLYAAAAIYLYVLNFDLADRFFNEQQFVAKLLYPIAFPLSLAYLWFSCRVMNQDGGGKWTHCKSCGKVLLASDLVDSCYPCDLQLNRFQSLCYHWSHRKAPRKVRI